MWAKLIGWIIKSKIAKAGGATIGGGGAIALIFGLHTSVTGEISRAETRSKTYVDLSLKPFTVEINNLKEKVEDTNDKVNKLYDHLIQQKPTTNE